MPGPDAEALGRRLLPHGSDLFREVIERRPWRVVVDVAICYAAIVASFVLMACAPGWWSSVIAFIVIGNRQYALSILTHDGDHRTLFARRATNDLFARAIVCAPVGVDFDGERENHIRHHRQLALETDPDRYLYSVTDKSTPASFLLFLTGLTMFPRALRKAMHGSARAAAPVPFSVAIRKFATRRGGTFVAQALIFTALCVRFGPWAYLAYWIAPLYVFGFVPHKIRMFCEHAQPIAPDSEADANRMITFLPSRLERLLFAPYNLNFHAEHHMWPYVPYYNLARLHALTVERTGVEVRTGYSGFLVAYLKKLPLMAAPRA